MGTQLWAGFDLTIRLFSDADATNKLDYAVNSVRLQLAFSNVCTGKAVDYISWAVRLGF
jgi:hypothetical protein